MGPRRGKEGKERGPKTLMSGASGLNKRLWLDQEKERGRN